MTALPRHRKINPALLGLFVVGALALLFVTVFLLAGGQLLVRKQQVVMHFGGSIYGLQVGAPVVFRGVRLGSVKSIGLAYDKSTSTVIIPVTAELDRDMLRNVSGGNKSDDPALALPGMVERGLRAQLAMQSLLTGQLYVDLDFRPDKPARRVNGNDPDAEIPTIFTGLQELQNQVNELDFKRLVSDISAIASSGRELLGSAELNQAVKDMAAITARLRSLTEKLDRRAEPLLGSAQNATDTARQALLEVGQAASSVGSSARRIADTAQGVSGTLGPDAPLVQSLRRAADELALTAAALRDTTANEAPLNQQLQRSLQDVAKAARALRELAETLDQQPEAVIKGRR
ncbi:MlaD family protein [Roseateles toxinivorans]|uniref:Paraquat-inducible protein B n=1 Tax=Roseateles toxinivorans TaxID=270368 RepID=A0A4R6QIW3_9BURK|nr:MlaD family protein [Roseateles toxinivorans]TDP61598.1 paraquat-inducible protein B [Roseateles toxinivorans]